LTPKDTPWVNRIQLFHSPTAPEAAIKAISAATTACTHPECGRTTCW
jgi:hypothetical protein